MTRFMWLPLTRVLTTGLQFGKPVGSMITKSNAYFWVGWPGLLGRLGVLILVGSCYSAGLGGNDEMDSFGVRADGVQRFEGRRDHGQRNRLSGDRLCGDVYSVRGNGGRAVLLSGRVRLGRDGL